MTGIELHAKYVEAFSTNYPLICGIILTLIIIGFLIKYYKELDCYKYYLIGAGIISIGITIFSFSLQTKQQHVFIRTLQDETCYLPNQEYHKSFITLIMDGKAPSNIETEYFDNLKAIKIAEKNLIRILNQ